MMELPVKQSPHFPKVESFALWKTFCPGGKVENYVDNSTDPYVTSLHS